MQEQEQEQEQARQLRKTRAIATGLLVLMALLFFAAQLLQPRYPLLSFVAAFAEAAMVGALADWFAVTALFRAPLGLPIPHTAIIARNKDRIGDSLSDFLEKNFITQDIVRDELRRIDFSGAVADWLAVAENSRLLSRRLVRAVPALLRLVDDEHVRQFIQRQGALALDRAQFAPLLGEILTLLSASGHHAEVFDHFIGLAAKALEQNKPYIRWKIHESSPRWMPKSIDDRFYLRLLEAAQSTLAEMREEDSEWRLRFHRAFDALIVRLRTSPKYEAKIDAIIRDVLGHPAFRNYILQLWHRLQDRLVADAQAEESLMACKLDGALQAFGQDLLSDRSVQIKLNQWIRITATEMIVSRRETIADLVARVIRSWDADTMSRKLELHVGRDLQYIRINGTVVGGLVGLLLHLATLWIRSGAG